MAIKQLIARENVSENSKTAVLYSKLEALLTALSQKQIPDDVEALVNQEIEALNVSKATGKTLAKQIKIQQNKIIKIVEKAVKIVPKNYYRSLWLVLGMSVFGVPLGVAFGAIIGNMGLLGVGLPIGMGIGVLVGSTIDKKAFKEGRQLDFEAKI